MLWMSLRFPELSIESLTQAQPPRDKQAFALSQLEGRREFVVAVNQEARRRGINPGQSLSAAKAICADLEVRPHESKREQALLKTLATALHRFSPDICLDSLGSGSALLIEVSRTWQHFGGERSFLEQLQDFLKHLGHQHRIVISPGAAASSLLSRWLPSPRVLRTTDEINQELDQAPWQLLEPEGERVATLRILGLETLADLRALPRSGLRLRLGDGIAETLLLAYGEKPADLSRFQAPRRFRQKVEWWPPTQTTSSLLFAAKRLFDLAEIWLESRNQGLLAGSLSLKPSDRREAATNLLLRPRRALSDSKSLMRLLTAKIENLCLKSPIDSLVLRIEAERNLMPKQGLLFSEDQELSWTQEAMELLDRLASRLGETSVLTPQLEADHRPEFAFSWQPAGLAEERPEGSNTRSIGRRPIELEAQPKRIDIELGSWGQPQGMRTGPDRGPIQILSGPERLASGWWTGEDLIRDYYMIATEKGRRLWIYQDRVTGFWFRHGAFS